MHGTIYSHEISTMCQGFFGLLIVEVEDLKCEQVNFHFSKQKNSRPPNCRPR